MGLVFNVVAGLLVAAGVLLAFAVGRFGPFEAAVCIGLAGGAALFVWASRWPAERQGKLLRVMLGAIAALGFAELTLRIVQPPAESSRWLFWSRPHFRLDDRGALRFDPDEEVREVAVYGDSIEYDNTFSVNNVGLIDHRDYPARPEAVERLALVGDSFTAGTHDGPPWVPAARDRLWESSDDVDVYNLGVDGTGIHNFGPLLASLQERLGFNHVVVLLISDDLFRPRWRPVFRDSEVHFCPEGVPEHQCVEESPIGHLCEASATEPELVTLGRQFAERERTALTIVFDASALWRGVSFALTRLAHRRSVGDDALETIGALAVAHSESRFQVIHLPEVDEVRAGAYRVDIEEALGARGVDYFPALHECEWSDELFHERDPHPNRQGYEAIARCVGRRLGWPEWE